MLAPSPTAHHDLIPPPRLNLPAHLQPVLAQPLHQQSGGGNNTSRAFPTGYYQKSTHTQMNAYMDVGRLAMRPLDGGAGWK